MTNIFTLNEVCDSLEDGNWIESKDQSRDGIRLIQTGNIKSGYFMDNLHKARYISEKTFNELNCKEVFEGDVLISRLPEPVGRGCILPKLENKSITAVDCTIVKVKKNILNTKYLNYFLQSPQYQFQINQKVTGTTRLRISRKNLGEINIPVPSLQEQEKIVRRLDQMNSSVNTNKNIINNRIEKLQTLRKSYEKNIFQSSGEQPLLKDLCNMTQGVQIPKSKQKSTRVNNGWSRYFYISDFKTDKNIKYVENEYPKKVFSEKDVIVVNTGASAGDVFKGFSGILSNNLFKVEITDKRLSNDYLYSFLKSSVFKDYQITKYKGTANPHMGHENFGNTPVLLPSLEIQERIVEQLSNLYKIVNHNTWSQSLEFSDKLFKAYLNKEFSYE